jgi:acyl carrier protein
LDNTTTSRSAGHGGGRSGGRGASWEDFAAQVAELVEWPPDKLLPTTRVIEDLGLDSLSLAELVVILVERYDMNGLSQTLEERVWENLTVGALYDEYLTGAPQGTRRSSTR